MNILIVDDDKAIRNGIKQIIALNTDENHSIFEAEDGLQALRILHESDISFVFVDIRMPIMDGIRMLEISVSLFPNTSFVVISAYGEFEYAQKALRLGAVDYLLKPVNPNDLISVIRNKEPKSSNNPDMVCSSDTGCKLRADVKESLRLLITDGIFTDFFPNSISPDWVHEEWNVVTIDVNETNSPDISLLRYYCSKAFTELGIKGCFFEESLAFALISSKCLPDWVKHLSMLLNEKNISFSIGISTATTSLESLSKCYYEAKEALQYRLVEKGNVFCYKPRSTVNYAIDEQLNRLILLSGKSSLPVHVSIISVIDNICSCCKTSPGQFLSLIDRFCLKLATSAATTDSQIQDKLNVDSVLDQIRLARSKNEIANHIERFVGDIVQITSVSTIDYYGQVIKQAKEYIQQHLTEDITLDMVADSVNLSSAHLSRLFHKVSGVNFITYLTDLRLEEGKKLLESGQYRIYEVADKVGYSSWKHFSRLFRQKYGLSPNEFLGKK